VTFSELREHELTIQGWMVRCEKGGLRRVLMNLVGNSLKFTTVCAMRLVSQRLVGQP
jgi:signal transduction histidine kinase